MRTITDGDTFNLFGSRKGRGEGWGANGELELGRVTRWDVNAEKRAKMVLQTGKKLKLWESARVGLGGRKLRTEVNLEVWPHLTRR